MADGEAIPARRRSEDWIGHRQGHLTIVAFEGIRRFKGGGKATTFRFRCDCGQEFVSQKSNVIGRLYDCGCSKPERENTSPPGSTRHPLYKIWSGIIQRCENPNCKSFKDYGARGIRICDRWKGGADGLTGFECFVLDMGPRPGAQTIERVQTHRGYEPGNCVWLPKPDQSKNRRNVRLIRIGRDVKTIPEWCRVSGLKYWTALRRIKSGWPPDRAVTEPVRRRVA